MRIKSVVLVVGLLVLTGCSGGGPGLDDAVELFYQDDMEQALQSFQLYVSRHPDNPEAQVWLAETYRRMDRIRPALEAAQKALELDPGQCYAHVVIADSRRPPLYAERNDTDVTWIALNRAVECDPTDGNAWMSIWNEAVLRRKPDIMSIAVKTLRETGFLSDAVLAYARWTLKNLPENSILVTNGDLDTIPMLALQITEDYRTDVIIVERGLLGTAQFLRHLRDEKGVTIPVEEDGLAVFPDIIDAGATVYEIAVRVFTGWIAQSQDGIMTRPLAISTTVYEDFYLGLRENLLFTGPFLLWQNEPIGVNPATAELKKNLDGIVAEDFAGKWASERDRSPVRRRYTKNIVTHITATAIAYCDGLILEDRLDEARGQIEWIDAFEANTEMGPAFVEKMAELRAIVAEE